MLVVTLSTGTGTVGLVRKLLSPFRINLNGVQHCFGKTHALVERFANPKAHAVLARKYSLRPIFLGKRKVRQLRIQ